ncbi:MAG TPA: peptidylprolyl isomerase [Vicinamibacterales bacterium]|nr:peptidylprolyl isomerase [Vicinamibacterales bacterium]
MTGLGFVSGKKLRSSLVMISAAVGVCFMAACGKTPAATSQAAVTADTWAVVDGRTITREEVETAFRRTGEPGKTMSEEEALTAKLGLLNDLIVQDVLLAKARELKVELPDSELDTAYTEAWKNIGQQAFDQELSRRNLTPANMREGLRRELLSQKLIEREVRTKVAVTDQEVTDFYNANRAQFNLAEEAYHIAQIAITPVAEAQVPNRTGDDATSAQAANAKVAMVMEKLKAGASFRDLAMDYSEDPQTAPRGGDLGFVPVSALKQAPAPLRDAVLKAKPGTANVVSIGGGHTIVLVVAHQQAGQRDLSTPEVKETITETLRGRKEQLLRAAYLTAIRTDAKVTNHLARRLVETQGKMPSIAPAAPGAK